MRVCVVGCGLAGAAAALTLREGGAEVRVLYRAPGASAMGGGTFDFAAQSMSTPGCGDSTRSARTASAAARASPALRIAKLLGSNPRHPYHALLDPAQASGEFDAALRKLNEWLSREGIRVVGRGDRSALYCDTSGGLRVGDAALVSVAAGDLSGGRRVPEVAVVAMPGLRAWNAAAVAQRIRAETHALWGAGLRTTLVDADWPESWHNAGETPARFAALLDDPGALSLLREALRPAANEERLILLPPVLGLDPKNPLHEALGQALTSPVAECAGLPPLHIAGVRLHTALERALDRAGIERVKTEVIGIDERADEMLELRCRGADGDPQVERCDAAVMATGRFVGGGVREGETGLEEPLRSLPLRVGQGSRRVDGLSAQSLTHTDYRAPQPLYQAGIEVDPSQRPLGEGGKVASHRIFAAGEVVGGYDPALEGSGHGVAWLSGLRAGAEALRVAEAAP